jgi:hypothetical protein
MNPLSDNSRSRVLFHFESCRAAPGTPFEEERFLDYLIANPSSERAAYNSFSGLRRLNRFIDKIQIEFAICFSMNDRNENYALERFIQRILELTASRRSSLASLRNRQRHSFGWIAVIFANLLAFPIWMAGFRWKPLIGWALIGACAAATSLAVRLYIHDKLYLRRLSYRILERDEMSERADR